jgi:hypothetical protein
MDAAQRLGTVIVCSVPSKIKVILYIVIFLKWGLGDTGVLGKFGFPEKFGPMIQRWNMDHNCGESRVRGNDEKTLKV